MRGLGQVSTGFRLGYQLDIFLLYRTVRFSCVLASWKFCKIVLAAEDTKVGNAIVVVVVGSVIYYELYYISAKEDKE